MKIWMAGILSLFFTSAMAMEPLESRKWAEDIEVLHTELRERHIDLYHRISRHEFRQELDGIKGKLSELTAIQAELGVWRALHQIGGGVSDGHTSVLLDFRRYKWLPLKFAIYGEDVRVVGATAEHRALLGQRIIKFGDTNTASVLNSLSEIAQFTENRQSERFFLSTILRCADVLYGMGYAKTSATASFTLQSDDGRVRNVNLSSASYAISREIGDGFPSVTPSVGEPPDPFSSTLWFSKIQGLPAVYVKFDRYPELEDMEEFGRTLASFVQKNTIRNLIIDLRENFGGNGFIGHRLAAAVLDEDTIDWRDGVFVLTGAQTYSAAMMNAVEFRQVLNARIVGEPTGGNPVGYQDSDRFKLPNSGLVISYSKRLYRMQSVPTNGVQPDVHIPVR